jgi:hypothetical protein
MRHTPLLRALRPWLAAIGTAYARLCFGDPPAEDAGKLEFGGKVLVGEGNVQLVAKPAGGIGISVSPIQDSGLGLKIDTVFPGTSAAKAGLKTGWIITLVDDVPLAGLSMTDCVRKLSGPVGTFARIEVIDPKKLETVLVFQLMRQDFARIAPAARAAMAGGLGGNLIVREERPIPPLWNIKLEGEDTVGAFSKADQGAVESIRSKLTDAGIPFLINAGEINSISTPPARSKEARAILLQLQANGHWSIILSPPK